MSTRREAFKEFLSSGSGKVGIAFFLAIVVVSMYALSAYPLDFGTRRWSNPALWADNPKAAPPTWINLFSGHRRAEHRVLEAEETTYNLTEQSNIVGVYSFEVDYGFDEAPTFMSFTTSDIEYYSRPPVFTISLLRPDDRELELYTLVVTGPREGEMPPIARYDETPKRVQLSGDSTVAYKVSTFMRQEFGVTVSADTLLVEGLDEAVFGTPLEGNIGYRVLKGEYRVEIKVDLYDSRDSVGMVKYVLGGSVYGLMGTDTWGRDLAVGLLFGFPVALFIGLVTSTLTTAIGTSLGIVSGYRGGKTDTFIQRGCDILANIPLLPILIFLAFLLGQKLWVVVLILIAFGWPGLTIIIRSMVLQIRSSQFIVAASALGGSRRHIMLRHIFPQTAPFVFAQLIFSTPSAILAEAGLSFLGLGDPSLPTWGQILEHGFRNGGVYVGYWWWVVPPGLLIVLTALTFVLIALALEPIVNPRLRRER